MSTYFRNMRTFSKDARLYLTSTFLFGLVFGLQYLVFNLYILSLGYGQGFVGLLAGIPAFTTAILSIPIGMMLPRVGYKRALVAGAILQLSALAGWSLLPMKGTLIAASVLFGMGQAIGFISASPFMVAITAVHERTHLFSMQFALSTVAGVIASLVGGVLPRLFSHVVQAQSNGPMIYRLTLMVGMGITLLAMVPLVMMRKKHEPDATPWTEGGVGDSRRVISRLIVVEVVVSLGAGILIPFVNVFYRLRFHSSDQLIGVLFAASSLTVGMATLLGPLISQRMGKVRAIVLTQTLSIPFLLLMGFAGGFSTSATGYLVRTALMNMSAPLFSAYAMGVVPGRLRAITSSLLVLAWNGGWAISAAGSGRLQAAYGFSPLFAVTAGMYVASIAMTYFFFHRHAEEEGD